MTSNFFQRWSARSLAGKDAAVSDVLANDVLASDITPSQEADMVLVAPDDGPALQAEPALSEPCADPICEQVTLTDADVDKVTFDTGVASFLQQGVDKKLKQAALAKLFHSDEFNYISDMDDHTEDFSNIPKLDEGIAKQLRGWVKTALAEPEQAEDESSPDLDMLAANAETTEPVSADGSVTVHDCSVTAHDDSVTAHDGAGSKSLSQSSET